MKAYVRAPYSEDCLQELRQMFDEVVYEPWTATGERYYEDEMLENLRRVQPDVLITELDRVTEKVLSGYDGLRVIGDCRGTPANLDVEACTRHGVPILCTPGRNTQAVAEMVVGLILTVMRKTIPATQWVKDGKWVTGTTPYYLWMGNELQGKKVGFVGFGAISHAVAKILDALERVLRDEAIAGAIIDVLDTEPPEEKDLALLKCPNVLLTPHICGATYEVTDHQSRILNDRLRKWLAGEDLEHTVYNRGVLKA